MSRTPRIRNTCPRGSAGAAPERGKWRRFELWTRRELTAKRVRIIIHHHHRRRHPSSSSSSASI
eukprot:349235-Karenia_brevis.AAC.1